MDLAGISFFILGFIIGGGLMWLIGQRNIDSVKKNQDDIELEFKNLSNSVLLDSQEKFLELAASKFSDLLQNSDKQLENKKELID